MAFLSAPGMVRLYSGVTNSTPSAAAISCLKRVHGAGGSDSISWLNNGRSPISTIVHSRRSAAMRHIACATLRLREPARSEPTTIAILCFSMPLEAMARAPGSLALAALVANVGGAAARRRPAPRGAAANAVLAALAARGAAIFAVGQFELERARGGVSLGQLEVELLA